MIRVSTQLVKNRTVVTIEGHMVESDVKEVRRIRRTLRGEASLKLRGLDVLAECGILELRTWLDDGARLEDANPFLRMRLTIGVNDSVRVRKKSRTRAPPAKPPVSET